MKKLLNNDRGDLTFATCFIILALVMLISYLLLFASIQINCTNIRNGAKMELNNLSASIYADTYRSQRETNMSEYINTLYSSSSYTRQLEASVKDGLSKKVALQTDDYHISNIRLSFKQDGDQIEYTFTCDAEFYITMFGDRYPTITKQIELTGHHNTKF